MDLLYNEKNVVIKNYTDVQLKNVDYQYNDDLTKN